MGNAYSINIGFPDGFPDEALGLVELSVEPHLDMDHVSEELLELSEEYPLYGICDDSAIICTENNTSYIGDVFLIDKRQVTQIG
jgi:dipeptidase E